MTKIEEFLVDSYYIETCLKDMNINFQQEDYLGTLKELNDILISVHRLTTQIFDIIEQNNLQLIEQEGENK